MTEIAVKNRQIVAPLSNVEKLFRITPVELPPKVMKPNPMIKQFSIIVDTKPRSETLKKSSKTLDLSAPSSLTLSLEHVVSEWYKSGAVK
jgi:hypothetical protein